MRESLISCIVPVFNGARYLGEALDSIRAQTYRPLEIIVVDDGSTDGTAAVVRGYGQQVRSLWQPNAGPASARNQGLGAARGDYMAFLDADDIWHPEKLARQMARFQARPELDMCLTHVQNFWISELQEEAERYRDHRISQPVPGHSPVALLARKSLFDRVGPFDTTLRHVHDTDWFARAAELGVVMEMLPDVLVFRRLHHANRSRVLSTASLDEHLSFLKARLDRRRGFKEAGVPNQLRPE